MATPKERRRGVGCSDRGEPRINLHVDARTRTAATREEIGPVLAMCVQTGGGPAQVNAAHALAARDEMAVVAARRRVGRSPPGDKGAG